jgi:hypothetical protein
MASAYMDLISKLGFQTLKQLMISLKTDEKRGNNNAIIIAGEVTTV